MGRLTYSIEERREASLLGGYNLTLHQMGKPAAQLPRHNTGKDIMKRDIAKESRLVTLTDSAVRGLQSCTKFKCMQASN